MAFAVGAVFPFFELMHAAHVRPVVMVIIRFGNTLLGLRTCVNTCCLDLKMYRWRIGFLSLSFIFILIAFDVNALLASR